MDFESPDVAKEFPGLYMGDLEVGMKNEDDEEQDKSKKKKDKKKDKEKGYAALAGESSHDEDDDSKSPGKSKKIKAFKLTSSKKKDKEPKPLDMRPQTSSILRTGSIREKRPFDREKKPLSEKELRKSVEKDVKRQMSPATSSSTANPRLSLPTTSAATTTHPPPERTHSLTKNLTLNAFLNAPAPLLKKKMTSASQKDKESVKKDNDKVYKKEEIKKGKDKEKDLIPSLVRLKLKRGSKNSLEDSQSDSPVAPSHQFPESPDAIAKEIRRYEVLLEQTHAQIKSSKKVSKKSEEQLWELQRTLTQLKRKLRSVNALSSASSANIVLSHSSLEKSAKDSEKLQVTSVISSVTQTVSATASIPAQNLICAESTVGSASVSAKNGSGPLSSEVPQQQQPKLNSPIKQGSPTTTIIKIETSACTSIPFPDGVRRTSMHLDTSVDSTEELQSHEMADEYKKEEPAKNIELSNSPGANSLEKVQVHVQVHNNVPEEREIILTPEDIFEKEIESFDAKDGVEPARNCPSPIIMGECPTLGSSAKSEASDSVYEDDSSEASNDGEPIDERDYPEIPEVEAKPLIDRSEESPDDFVPAFIVEESDEFDPFTLPIFRTDEFISHENEALIGFNQKLQDEIVKEEESITALIEEYKYLTEAGYRKNAMEDLESLDDDELAELWYSRKTENEALHDKVNNLRKQVVAEILAEFRLETRLHYLQENVSSSTTNGNKPCSTS